MPALSPVLNLYFDTTKYGASSQQLLQSLLSPTLLAQLGIVAEDVLTLNLWPRATSGIVGANTTSVQLANPGALIFSAKEIGDLNAGTLLLYANGFTEQTDDNGNYYYTSQLSLQKSQLLAAIGDQTYLPVLLELENVGTGFGYQRFQFPATIYPAVYIGTETLPTSALPTIWDAVQSDARYIRADSGLTGKIVLASGVDSYAVAGLALPFLPDTVLAWVNQVGGAIAPVFGVVDESSITAEGFMVYFSGLTTDAVHVLRWLCLPAPGVYTNGNPAVPPTAQNVIVTTSAAAINLALPGIVSLDVTAATGTVALTLTNPVTGADYVFEVIQGAVPRGITFPGGTKQKGGGGGAYTPSGANQVDVIRLSYDGTDYLLSVEDNYA